jgi:drug/metabolite transporter (DMT)-like permease
MSWQILIITGAVFYAFASVLQKVLMRDKSVNPWMISIFYPIIVGLLITIYGFSTGQFTISPLDSLELNLLFLVIGYGLGNVCVFKALQTTDLSNYVIIFGTRVIFSVIASTILLNHSLSLVQGIGGLLIFTAVILLNLNKSKLVFHKGDLYALGAAICFGLALVNDKVLLSSLNLYYYLLIGFVCPSIFLMVLKLPLMRELPGYLNARILVPFFGLCIIYSASAILFFGGLQQSNNSSQVAVLNLTQNIFAVFLSIIILKEMDSLWKKIVGLILSFIGMVLVSM